MSDWEASAARPLAVEVLGERYRRYRLCDPAAEEAMARSLQRYGQIAPVVVCVHDGSMEVVDGFKRLAAARLLLPRWTTLSVRVLAVDERGAKAAIYGLNRVSHCTHELEEAWIVHALVREDGLSQVEAAALLGRHKSFNEVTLWWLANVADARVHGETKQTPLERYAAEKAHLIALPAHAYDIALVLYRSVNAEGFIAYRQNFYAAPFCYIGQLLPVRITEHEVVVYSPTVEEVARHGLVPRTRSGQRQVGSSHPARADANERFAVLAERFHALVPAARRFLDGLLAKQRQGKYQAQHVLALLASYQRSDWLAALERAVRFGAYSLAAVERILAATAKPRSILACLAEQERQHLEPYLRDDPVAARPTAAYQHLLTPETSSDGPPPTTPTASDSAPDAAAS